MDRQALFHRCGCLTFAGSVILAMTSSSMAAASRGPVVVLPSRATAEGRGPSSNSPITLDAFFYETTAGRVYLPVELGLNWNLSERTRQRQAVATDGHTVRLDVVRDGQDFVLRLHAAPSTDILRWGLSVQTSDREYFTGLMERVVDGPQADSWAPGIQQAMDLRGQIVEMLVKPTTSLYAPFYLSSQGYSVFVKGTWPGRFDFGASDPTRVAISFDGPSFEMKLYASGDPAEMVRRHSLDAGPPFLPPAWAFGPWRWRDEHTQRAAYYDGTPVGGPFNAEVMEDVLMMKAYGVPCSVYWIDRPYGLGPLGYDDFEVDPARMPNFADMVTWLRSMDMRTVLWIAPFLQGKMAEEGISRGYTMPGQDPTAVNYPLVDFSNPAATAFWQDGVSKLLNLGVAGFKLDRSEEDIPSDGPYRVFDGRSVRENRNAYPAMYVKAGNEVARKHRGNDFVVMPRAGYTGSAPYGVFWGGDIGGTQEGLRASIIAVQRAAVMGYPNWGSDTCGYNEQLMETEVCGRWLAFSSLTPIMEVGPTRNRGFWDLPRDPTYDVELIAQWRLYARLHARLAGYSHRFAQIAAHTGMPIVRPLFLVEPRNPAAWSNWWTYLYGTDLVVSPVWEKGQRQQQVYLPAGSLWRNAWRPQEVHAGGRTVTVAAEAYQIPLFVRVGSPVELGNLEREYAEAREIAARKPDLKALDAEVQAWFVLHPTP